MEAGTQGRCVTWDLPSPLSQIFGNLLIRVELYFDFEPILNISIFRYLIFLTPNAVLQAHLTKQCLELVANSEFEWLQALHKSPKRSLSDSSIFKPRKAKAKVNWN